MDQYIAPFEAVSQSLYDLILRDVLLIDNQAGVDAPVDISFEVPDADFVADLGEKPTIDVYLYGLQENINQRYGEHFAKIADAGDCKHVLGRRPRFIDVHYGITVWMRGRKNIALTEHNLLSRLVQGIGKHQLLPSEFLLEHDFDVGPYGVTVLLLGQDNIHSQGEFWNALGSRPKPMVNLVLTVPVQVYDPAITPYIDQINRRFGFIDGQPKELVDEGSVVLSGHVIRLDGVEGFSHLVVNAEYISGSRDVYAADVDHSGCYRFSDLKAGFYRVLVKNMLTGKSSGESFIEIKVDDNGSLIAVEKDLEVYLV